MKTILFDATLIDCVDPVPRQNAFVTIEDGRIQAIGTGTPAAGDAKAIDLKGAYLIPGLWDVHIHPDYLTVNDMPLPEQVTLFVIVRDQFKPPF